MDNDDLIARVLQWYASSARELPWRQPDASPWAVLVSEFMLQQTPVNRVLPVYAAWLERWPTPAALADASAGEAIRMWGKLGYPRRALRLHECARILVAEYAGEVPDQLTALLRLPGVGEYTARAIAAFAFGRRVPVVDTNVRRVFARAQLGQADAGSPSPVRDHGNVAALLPDEPALAARFSVALMELGALICTARAPRCADCVLADGCEWLRAGRPEQPERTVRRQLFTGTDRQARGRLLDVLRGQSEPVTAAQLDVAWPEPVQRGRALATLVRDGLVTEKPGPLYALPG